MNRRNFIFSTLFSAAGSALFKPLARPSFGREPEKTPTPVENSPVPVHGINVMAAILDGKTVLTKCSGESISLNETGAAIWNSIDGRKNCYGIAEIHSRRFGLADEDVAADVKEFVSALVERGYLRIARMTPCYRLGKAAERGGAGGIPTRSV